MKDVLLQKYGKKKGFNFIQIGSGDGIYDDPIRKYIIKYKWKGIMLEPIPINFKKLIESYPIGNNIEFVNKAIFNKKGFQPIYTIDKITSKMPKYAHLISSFYPKIIQNHPISNDNITTIEVECVTFNDLIREYNITELDLLHIDCEGYDTEIIKSIDFSKIKPNIIMYEYIHTQSEANQQTKELLEREGYTTLQIGYDIIAYIGDKDGI